MAQLIHNIRFLLHSLRVSSVMIDCKMVAGQRTSTRDEELEQTFRQSTTAALCPLVY